MLDEWDLPEKRRSGPLRSLGVVVVVAVLVAGVAVLALAVGRRLGPTTHRIGGDMTIIKTVHPLANGGCSGATGYDDIDEGAAVTVKNQAGSVIGTGSLGPGVASGDRFRPVCVFPLQVLNVKDASFYQVEVTHRGALTFSKADMEKNAWTIHASLGA